MKLAVPLTLDPSSVAEISCTVTTGVSFVPVIVTSTVWSVTPPCPSESDTLNVSTFVSPSARYCVAEFGTVYVQLTVP